MKFYLIAVLVISGICGQAIAGDCDNLATEQLTNNDTDDTNIKASGNNAVWVGVDANGHKQVFFYNGNEIKQLTDSNTDNIKPQVKGKKVAWQGQDTNEGDWEIFFYKAGCIRQVTNNAVDDINPRLTDTRIFWELHEATDSEIMTAAVPKEVIMVVTPRTINLKSKGQFINVKLVLDGSLDAGDVNLASLKLSGIPADKVVVSERFNMLTIKFDRADIQATLVTGEKVEIILTGKLNDGTVFTASDTVKVINPGQAQSSGSWGVGGISVGGGFSSGSSDTLINF